MSFMRIATPGAVLFASLLFGYAGDTAHSASAHDRARPAKENVTVRNVSVDKRRDGPVDYKIRFKIASSISGAEITVECAHREPGVPNWALFITADDETNQTRADGVLVGQALVLAAKTLHHDYSSDPIWAVCLPPAAMPRGFTKTALQAIREEMKGAKSRPSGFDDERVRAMVARAYRKMEGVRQIKTELERDGFSVRIDTDELCHLRRSTVDRTWREISTLPDAGLDLENARCWLFLHARAQR